MGKGLIIIGGLLTLVSTYVLTFYANGSLYAWGYPALSLVPDIFTNPGNYVVSLPPVMGYAIGVLLVIFLLAGLLQMLGVANRGLGTLGGVFALLGCGYITMVFMTGTMLIPLEYTAYVNLFAGPALIPGTIPFHFGWATTEFPGTLGLGILVLLAGGILGLIGQARRD